MSDPFLGEIRMVGFTFAPYGWALCNGAILPVSQNTALFSLLGKLYGGDGINNFGLPDYRGRVPVGMGTGVGLTPIAQGATGGAETVTLTQAQMPQHTHTISLATTASSPAYIPTTTNNVLGASGTGPGQASIWSTTLGSNPVAMSPTQIGTAGGATAVPLRNPYLGTNFIIATTGIYPTQG